MNDKKLINEMNAYYDRRARWHDGYMSYESNAKMEALLAPIVERIEKYVSDRDVLEIACGTGNWTQVLARRAESVVATDVNESTIRIARQKEYVPTQPEFVITDAYDLDLGDRRFETAFMADWWAHIPRQRLSMFLEGLYRHLHADAYVVVVDMMPREDPEGGEVFIDNSDNRIHRRTLPDGSRFEVVKNHPTRDELVAAVEPWATDIKYIEDEPLQRWMLTYRLRV